MAGISQPTSGSSSNLAATGKSYTIPLIILTTLFFMWGFITCMNDILIPFFKKEFMLSNFQAGLVQSFFFFAYFVIALSYFIISSNFGDPISKIGYKNGIIVGLLVAALGCCTFYPAAEAASYPLFLLAFFILAAGITILQMAANPYVALLGNPESSSSRLNMTQAFNSLGTTIAPIIGSAIIFSESSHGQKAELSTVQTPYIGLALALVFIAIMIGFSKLPKVEGEKIEKGLGVLKFNHLTLGVVAIFMYVGGEVAIGSYMANYFGELEGLKEATASKFIAFYWGGSMIGRFIGAFSLSGSGNSLKKYLIIGLITLITMTVVYFYVENLIETTGITFITSTEVGAIIFGLIVFNIIAFQIGGSVPSKTLGLFAFINMSLIAVSSFSGGVVAMWAIIAMGLFNSIMFPTIFTLAIKDLGKYTTQGASLLIMAIVGGAIITPVTGILADVLGGFRFAYLLPIACYGYIAFYGFIGSKPSVPVSALKSRENELTFKGEKVLD